MPQNPTASKMKNSLKRITDLRDLILCTPCPMQRCQLENRMIWEIDRLLFMLNENMGTSDFDESLNRQRTFTPDELAKYNGSGGNPAYVSINGIVYDVTNVPAWGGGTHFGLYSGKDLTSYFTECHKNNMKILNRLPIVGTLKV